MNGTLSLLFGNLGIYPCTLFKVQLNGLKVNMAKVKVFLHASNANTDTNKEMDTHSRACSDICSTDIRSGSLINCLICIIIFLLYSNVSKYIFVLSLLNG